MKPRICVSVKTDDSERVRKAILFSQRLGANLVELRLDYAREEDYENIIRLVEGSKIGCVATVRPVYEGGVYEGDEEKRLQLFKKMLEAPFKYVDIEYGSSIRKNVVKLAKGRGVGVILSYHDWEETPSISRLERLLAEMRRHGADVYKMVTTVNNPVDEATLLSFILGHAKKMRLVCFGMGDKGIATRIVSPLLGGFMTYASYDEALAPGQVALKDMISIYRRLGAW